jgi:TPR repeat protein
MRKYCRSAALLAALLAFDGFPAHADQLDDAAAAYDRGDYVTAFRLIRPLALSGDPVAQYHLGLMYLNGEGTRQNAAEATKWFRLAAEQGDPRAQLSIGISY